jgi:hypothetical protein
LIIYNYKYKNFPIIIHCPGKNNTLLWENIVKIFNKKKNKISKSFIKDLEIITWNNKKEKGILEKSLDNVGLHYTVLGVDVENWSNPSKIYLTIDYLKRSNSKYIIGLDSFDVFVLNNLNDILEKFLEFDCKILFNGGPVRHPPVKRPFVHIEEEMGRNYDYKYLNAGVWMGEKDYCLDFFKYCLCCREKDEDPNNEWWNKSEQFYIKRGFEKFYDNIKIDYESKIFQITHPFYCDNDLKILNKIF